MSARAKLMRALLRGFSAFTILFLGGAPAGATAAEAAGIAAVRGESAQRETRLVVDLLQNLHYSGRPFRDITNDEIVERYLSGLDPHGDLLPEPERAALRRRFSRTLKSVYLFRGDLQPATELFERFAVRANARLDWVDRRLAEPLPTPTDESPAPAEASTVAKSSAEADARWERKLQEMVLRQRLAGHGEVTARQRVAAQFARFRAALAAADPGTVREQFLDAMLRCYDPHSGYFSAATARRFALTMGARAGGIGLGVAADGTAPVVTEVTPGGPADLHSDLRPGDVIRAVTDADGNWRTASSVRSGELSAWLLGDAGTEVRLKFARPGEDGEREVALLRARLLRPDDRAQGGVALLPAAGDSPARRVGWIRLPSFYGQPEEGADGVSATRDVRALLLRMRPDELDGLVVDLRDNPGGLLIEAVSLTGLFLRGATAIHAGQVGQAPKAMTTPDEAPVYAGPLIVLTSGRTASAGEALAGALQHHRRAVVVGDEATYGKGSMQIYVELARAYPTAGVDSSDWGTLRVTSERFYLPDGRTVQRTGVKSDVVLPAVGAAAPREADLDHALPAGTLPVAPAAAARAPEEVGDVTPELIAGLREHTETHVATLAEWARWKRGLELAAAEARSTRSLTLATREAELADRLGELAARRREWLAWSRDEAWSIETVEVDVVDSARAAHAAAVRTRLASASPVDLLRSRHALCLADDGAAREIPLGHIDFASFVADAPLLAPAFAAGSGREVDVSRLALVLRGIAGLERRDYGEILRVLGEHLPDHEGWSEHEREAGFAGMLAALPGLDVRLQARPRPVDVPLREAVRLAAAWASRRTDSGRVSSSMLSR